MKKKGMLFAAALVALTVIGGVAFNYVQANQINLVKNNRRAVLATCKTLGLYPVFSYRKGGKSSFYVTATEPASAKALRLAQEAAAAGDAPVGVTTRAIDPTSTVGVTISHKEKVVKQPDKVNYSVVAFETITGDTKIFDSTVDNNLTGDTRIEVTMNGFTYDTTLDQGIKTKFDTPGKGFSKIQDMFWPGSDTKDNVFCTVKWAPSKIDVKTKMKPSRMGEPGDEFIANEVTATYTDSNLNSDADPKNIQDGDITVTVAYGLAIDVDDDSTADMTWALPGGQVAEGKKKTKVVKKKNKDSGEYEYYVTTNYSAKLKKAPTNRTK
jgi:hypothetical protein